MSARGIVARTFGGLVSLGLVAAVTVAGTSLGTVGQGAVAAVDVDVPTPRTTLVCPGPPRLPTEPQEGEDLAYDPQFDPAPVGTTTSLVAASVERAGGRAAVPLTLMALAAGATPVAVDVEGGSAVAAQVPAAGEVLRAEPGDGPPAWVAGSVVSRTDAGDLRGLVAGTCRAPAVQTWLVGGGTAVGASSRLVLQNPGSTPAVVRLELWGPAGAVEPAGTPEYLVPAGSERVVLLEGVAAGQDRLVVRLTSTGGLVTAYLQDSALRGLTPAGVDLVVGGVEPATTQVVAGVFLPDGAGTGPADVPVLRLLAPDAAGTAAVTVLGPDGVVALPGTESVSLEAGAVIDVPLDGLPAGDHTLVVTADVPVVAGAMLTAGAGVGAAETDIAAPLDRAWLPSVVQGTVGALAVAGDAAWRLVLAAPGDGGAADVTVEVLAADGAVLTTTAERVPEGRTLTVRGADLADGAAAAVVVRSADRRLAWSVVLGARLADGDLVAVLSPVVTGSARATVPVLLG
jgi:hypothetical protein